MEKIEESEHSIFLEKVVVNLSSIVKYQWNICLNDRIVSEFVTLQCIIVRDNPTTPRSCVIYLIPWGRSIYIRLRTSVCAQESKSELYTHPYLSR